MISLNNTSAEQDNTIDSSNDAIKCLSNAHSDMSDAIDLAIEGNDDLKDIIADLDEKIEEWMNVSGCSDPSDLLNKIEDLEDQISSLESDLIELKEKEV